MKPAKPPKRPEGLTRLLLRLPILAYRARLGWLLGNRFVLIEHTGRRTRIVRRTVVEVVAHDDSDASYIVAAGFGPATDWYRNLLAHPDTVIQTGNRRVRAWAHKLPPRQGAEVMPMPATILTPPGVCARLWATTPAVPKPGTARPENQSPS